MKAYVVRRLSDDFSGAGVEDVADPTPGLGEILVRIEAAGVNFPDLLMAQGLYQAKPPPPFTPGMEIAGVVEALGPGADGFASGQAVVGGVGLGGFAEKIAAPAAAFRPRPDTLAPAEAAAFQAAALTAYVTLVRRGRLQAGETLLVHGAAGGVGLACVDLGLHLGARVIACASSPQKRGLLEARGVAAALPASDFRDAVLALTDGRGADVIVDPVGGEVFDQSVRAIAFDGRLLSVGFASGRIPQLPVNMALIKGFSLLGVRAGEYGRRFPDRGRENLAAIWALAEAGVMRPHIHAILPLERVSEAFEMLRSRSVIGKVAIAP